MSDWKHGMCCNCSDPTTCLMGWCCPCILAWQTSKEFEQETYWGLIHCWLYPFTVPLLRNQIRETKGIDVSSNKILLFHRQYLKFIYLLILMDFREASLVMLLVDGAAQLVPPSRCIESLQIRARDFFIFSLIILLTLFHQTKKLN